MQKVEFHISTRTILKVVGFGLLFYFIYLVWNIVLILFVALIFSAIIDPFANWMQKHRIPRGLAVLFIYITLFGLIGLAIMLISPVVAKDLPQLIENLSTFWNELQQNEVVQRIFSGAQSLGQSFSGVGIGSDGTAIVSTNNGSGIFSTVTGFFGGVFSTVLVLVMTFYMVVQDDPLKKIVRSIAPDQYVPYISQLIKKMKDKLGAWMLAQLVLSIIVGLLVFVGLLLIGIKYAAVLGLLAALLEFVPYLGPILAAIPALLIAFSQGGALTFVFVFLLYIIIQQLENHLLVPKIMQRAVGLNPIVSIVAILIGVKIAGVVGALLAIPVATALSVFFRDVLSKKTTI